jgi:integrase/recombinase XerC/integrase/recombinase XerD
MEEKVNTLVIAPSKQVEIAALDVEGLVADWLHLDVANGDACSDTLKTYRWIFEAWLIWCRENQVHPGQATVEDVKEWRQKLVAAGSKPSTIALKLTTIRRFYQSAVDRRVLKSNDGQ